VGGLDHVSIHDPASDIIGVMIGNSIEYNVLSCIFRISFETILTRVKILLEDSYRNNLINCFKSILHLFELLSLLLKVVNEAVLKQYSNTEIFRILQSLDKITSQIYLP